MTPISKIISDAAEETILYNEEISTNGPSVALLDKRMGTFKKFLSGLSDIGKEHLRKFPNKQQNTDLGGT